jgi:membrane dipeptidase
VFFNRDLTVELATSAARARHDRRAGARPGTVTSRNSAGPASARASARCWRAAGRGRAEAGYKRTDLDYVNQDVAHCAAHAQLAWYRLMERAGMLRLLRTGPELRAHWEPAAPAPATTPLGVILSMEGADPVTSLDQLDEWTIGLRAIGPAHYGRGHYAFGTATDGPLGARGVELLRRMERLGFILDVTHLSDTSMAEALDVFRGPCWPATTTAAPWSPATASSPTTRSAGSSRAAP